MPGKSITHLTNDRKWVMLKRSKGQLYAAQDYLKQYETTLRELLQAGALKDKQKAHYESLLGSYQERMKEFRHKDQKPYWT